MEKMIEERLFGGIREMQYKDRLEGLHKLDVVYGDVTLGVHGISNSGKTFEYIWSYSRGGLESLVIDGKEWLYREPYPTFWRALTDNDRGNGFHLRSGMWLAADLFQKCSKIQVKVDKKEITLPIAPENNRYGTDERADQIEICFTYETITIPTTEVEVRYQVDFTGQIQVDVHYYGKKGLPELPVFGIRFQMPTKAVFYRYQGLSGENYPDRMAGGEPGIYTIKGLPVTPYLVPQDCNVHMETQWLEVYRNTIKSNVKEERKIFGIRFSSVENAFAFSCVPYTAEELENATHQEELPLARRTVVSILGAVRGVGGINSWGADVEEVYHISGEQDITFSFLISEAETEIEKELKHL